MKKVVVALVVLIVLGGGAFALTRNNDKTTANTTENTTTKNTTEEKPVVATGNQSQQATEANTIVYSDSGFSPAKLTVKTGTSVTIKNASTRAMQFDSDPHPSHTDDTELNVGIVQSGESMTFKVTGKGTHGYHNHLNPSDTGTIVVE
jgi:plastocyanin